MPIDTNSEAAIWLETLADLRSWIGRQPLNGARLVDAEDACDSLIAEIEDMAPEAPDAHAPGDGRQP